MEFQERSHYGQNSVRGEAHRPTADHSHPSRDSITRFGHTPSTSLHNSSAPAWANTSAVQKLAGTPSANNSHTPTAAHVIQRSPIPASRSTTRVETFRSKVTCFARARRIRFLTQSLVIMSRFHVAIVDSRLCPTPGAQLMMMSIC